MKSKVTIGVNMNIYYSIKQIEVFLRTSRTLSITKTAQELNMTAPAAWKHIHNIENLCNKKLFSRVGNKFLLTIEGAKVAQEASLFLEARDKFSFIISELSKEKNTTIYLSITNTFQSIIFSLIRPFLEKYPHVQLDLSIDKWEDQQKNLNTNKQDFFIISDPIKMNKDWSSDILIRSEFILTSSSYHPLAHKSNIKACDLKNMQFLITHSKSTTQQHQIKLMERWGVTRKPQYLDSYMAIREAVKANMGIAILPKITLIEDIEAKKLTMLPMDINKFSVETSLIHKKDKYHSSIHKLFKEFLILYSRNIIQ
jgi:DNA-binding transcriptional LysR family regulator